MIWSAQQEEALDKVGRWMKSGSRWMTPRDKPYFTLAGYAGTGKTTLAKHLASTAGGSVLFAAYTGKAAHVLRKTGIANVSTIHHLIYLPRTKCDLHLRLLRSQRAGLQQQIPVPADELASVEKDIKAELSNLSSPNFTLNTASPLMSADLIVIDEYSMIDRQMGEDLMRFGCPILALGDPGQLPPVNGDCFFDGQPDVMLTEIHRQAADNPIIRMSKDVREGKRLAPGSYGSSRVIRQRDITDAQLGPLMLSADQLLVGTHATRKEFNQYFRAMLGFKGVLPVKGDRLVCRRNNHEEGLFNGQCWTVQGCIDMGRLKLSLIDDDGREIKCLAHRNHFLGTSDSLDFRDRMKANEFDYGYALTVHKSQGSQWDSVILLDEWHAADHAKWLYTAITRAAESVTVIQ